MSGKPSASCRARVRITYDAETCGIMRKTELPFVVGVLADLSGRPKTPLAAFMDRKFTDIDRDNFDAVLRQASPRLILQVPDRLTGLNTSLVVELNFQRLEDFEPVRVAEQVGPLRDLLAMRRRLAQQPSQTTVTDVAEVDRRLSAQLNEIMHHMAFQGLEGTWRGLHYLVMQTETGERLKLRLLNCSKDDVLRDMQRVAEFDQSFLFEKVYEWQYGMRNGQPFGLLVGDYEFGPHGDDIALLDSIGRVAAAAHAPFIAAAAPKMLNAERLTQLAAPRELTKTLDGAEFARWRLFREAEHSRYVALTLPRVLARLPYNEDLRRLDEFNFDEFVDGRDHDKYLWMSAAWAYAARITDAYATYGWFARSRGVHAGGKVKGLPVHTFYTDDGCVAMQCPTEIAISDRREFELSNLGFLPLLYNKDTENAVFMGAQSCQKPKKYSDPTATAEAELSATFYLILCASRFAQYVKAIARDKFGSLMQVEDFERGLNDWIAKYCIGSNWESEEPSAERPLARAWINLRPCSRKPGWSQAVAHFQLHFQLDGITVPMRLVVEIPKLEGQLVAMSNEPN
jgi:type VI secretion system protein ImpC